MSESKKSETGLWPTSVLAGLTVRGLGLRVLTAQPVELALLIENLTEARLVLRLAEPFARPSRLVGGVLPGAMELHELGAIQEAFAGSVSV